MTPPRVPFRFSLDAPESPGFAELVGSVTAVIPCHNRPADLRDLLDDLTRLDRCGLRLRIIVVDNASEPPLRESIGVANPDVEWVRSAENRGGAGGFNTGMRAALWDPARRPDLVWLLDSDVRVHQDALRRLAQAMLADPTLVAAGSELRDTVSGFTYEIGGKVCRMTGMLLPAARGTFSAGLIACDYIAACSLLVRADAFLRTGMMPECFVYNDDVEWTIALRDAADDSHGDSTPRAKDESKAGPLKPAKAAFPVGRLVGIPGSIVYHPWGRLPGIGRYYAARNAYGAMTRLNLGRFAVFRHAVLDALFAMALSFLGLPRVAEAQIAGMADAARGRTTGRRPDVGPSLPATDITESFPIASLDGHLFDSHGNRSGVEVHPLLTQLSQRGEPIESRLARAYQAQQLPVVALQSGIARVASGAMYKLVRRLVLGPRVDRKVVPLGVFGDWLEARTALVVAGDRVHVLRIRPWSRMLPTLAIAVRGAMLAARIALRRHRASVLPAVETPTDRQATSAC